MIRYPRSPFGPAEVGESVPSPCINVCELDGEGMCMGCFRTADEIAAWPAMEQASQRRLLAVLQEREAEASGLERPADASLEEVRG